MACPFFHPVAAFEDGLWITPPRLPLGDPCRGVCAAGPGAPVEPGIEELRTFCNSGYARSRCERFPPGCEADAIRFSIYSDKNGSVELVYIVEKNYGPLRHGLLRYERPASRFVEIAQEPAIQAQAERFMESYLKRSITD